MLDIDKQNNVGDFAVAGGLGQTPGWLFQDKEERAALDILFGNQNRK